MVSALDLTPRNHKEFEGSQCHVFLGTTLNQKILSITQIFCSKNSAVHFFCNILICYFQFPNSQETKNLFLGATLLLEIHNRIPTKVPGGLDPIESTVELK